MSSSPLPQQLIILLALILADFSDEVRNTLSYTKLEQKICDSLCSQEFYVQVRYESRKKLAEQRPRVKGQFVRQVHIDPSPAETDQ